VNAGQRLSLTVNKSFENLAEFKYLRASVTDEIALNKKLMHVKLG
jgi:hypothetical protein